MSPRRPHLRAPRTIRGRVLSLEGQPYTLDGKQSWTVRLDGGATYRTTPDAVVDPAMVGEVVFLLINQRGSVWKVERP